MQNPLRYFGYSFPADGSRDAGRETPDRGMSIFLSGKRINYEDPLDGRGTYESKNLSNGSIVEEGRTGA